MNILIEPGVAHLNPTSRVWMFQSSKLLLGPFREEIENQIGEFLSTWAAHGAQLFSGFEILHDRFILIAVDEHHAAATGCSIDKFMRFIQKIDANYGLDLLNRMKVAYLNGDEVIECDVNTFRNLLKEGVLNENTVVFNNLITDLQSWRSGWQTTVAQSWHANLMV